MERSTAEEGPHLCHALPSSCASLPPPFTPERTKRVYEALPLLQGHHTCCFQPWPAQPQGVHRGSPSARLTFFYPPPWEKCRSNYLDNVTLNGWSVEPS